MKIPFDTIFDKDINNKIIIRVGGVTLYPNALKDYKGAIGGVDFSQFIGRDLEIELDDDAFVIKGIY